MKKFAAALVVSVFVFAVGLVSLADAAPKFRIAWSHYTGWEPWEYARHAGILKKHADKYGIEIELTPPMDYVESMNQYGAGKFHGVVITNMDILVGPSAGGVDSTAFIGDFSNGNDGIVLKNGKTVCDLRGRKTVLVEGSVSHYLLARGLQLKCSGLTERDFTVANVTTETDIKPAFIGAPNAAAVTWNPILMDLRYGKGVKMVFDSSQIPGEIIDMMVVRTDAPDSLKKALVGAWYETMKVMSGRGSSAKTALEYMAKFSGGTLEQFKAQLSTTAMFYDPAQAVAFAKSNQLKRTMELVRTVSFEKGFFGKNAKSKDDVGIQFPDGSVMGNPANVKLRFDAKFMQMAAEGKLN